MDTPLFEIPRPDPIRDGPCKTCGSTRASTGFTGNMFVEPVSLECHQCNHATVGELMSAHRARDLPRLRAAAYKHGLNPDRVRLPRRR